MAQCAANIATDVEIAIEFSFAIPSMVIYIIFMAVFYRSLSMKTSYYMLFLVHSCINMVYFISRALIMRVSSFSFIRQWVLEHYSDPEFTFTWLYFIYHYTQHAQALSIIAININRVLSVFCYTRHNMVKISTIILISATFLIPLPLTWHLLLSPVRFIVSLNMIGMDYTRIITYPGLSVLHLGMDCTATFIVVITGILILGRLKTRKMRNKSNERALIIVSMFLSLGLALSAIVQYIIYTIDRKSDTYFVILNYRWIITDFMSLFPPWSLLLLSSVVRKEFVRLLTCRGFTPQHSKAYYSTAVTRATLSNFR